MELTLDTTQRYTYADYLTWWDDKRRELMNGFITMMSPAPTLLHASVIIQMIRCLTYHIDRYNGRCKVFTAPFDVRLPKNGEREDDKIYTVVQPDVCVVCDPSKLDERGCLGAPDMIVEVLSPSTRKLDLNDKYRLYEAYGVKEYWVVSPKEQDVMVFLLQDDGTYAEGVIYTGNAHIPVQTLPGLEVEAAELFR